jgi:regulator of replication initiation timing
MAHTSPPSHFKKVRLGVIGVFLIALFSLGFFTFPALKKNIQFLLNTANKQKVLAQTLKTYKDAWTQIQWKVEQLRHLKEENVKLRLENAHLKSGLEVLEFGCNTKKARTFTKENEIKLTKITSTPIGRALQSLSYKPPGNLVPSQLYTLGVAYLKANEDEKVAAIFTALTNLDENKTYKTAKNLLIAGIAWYRLENYLMADHCFSEVFKAPEHPDMLPFKAQAKLWKALVAKKFNKEIKVQFWLKELVDHHPHAVETSWINSSTEVRRAH